MKYIIYNIIEKYIKIGRNLLNINITYFSDGVTGMKSIFTSVE